MASPSTPLPFADKGASEGRQAGIQIGKQASKQVDRRWLEIQPRTFSFYSKHAVYVYSPPRPSDPGKFILRLNGKLVSILGLRCLGFSRLPRTPLAYASYRMKEGWIGKRVSHRQGRRIVERILRKIVRVHSVLCNFDADEKKYFG
ncbi:hypothetical protein HZH66_014860 [Vespula vulgaris]|uniref:Uncharacterized protein n=1 Tax=Vespula vulgaris TaxID=7454 RepID=A0A834MQ08_VESVU|nr:hypothetical protein HZH66_014860 [Vespula vulgaris]